MTAELIWHRAATHQWCNTVYTMMNQQIPYGYRTHD